MPDIFATHSNGLDSPATKAFAITPDDATDLALTTRAIYTGTGGTLVCTLADDSGDATFVSLPAGCILPVRAKRVKATGTTASMNMIGLA